MLVDNRFIQLACLLRARQSCHISVDVCIYSLHQLARALRLMLNVMMFRCIRGRDDVNVCIFYKTENTK